MSGIAFGGGPAPTCPRVFISVHKHWKGVYLHLSHGTVRFFRANGKWGSDYRANRISMNGSRVAAPGRDKP